MSALFLLCAAVCSELSWLGLPEPESLKREDDGPDSPLALLLGHQSRSGGVPLIGSPRDFSIVPEDYGMSFPDSRPDALLAHQRRRTAYQPDFMAPIVLQQKSPPDCLQRGFSGICQRFM